MVAGVAVPATDAASPRSSVEMSDRNFMGSFEKQRGAPGRRASIADFPLMTKEDSSPIPSRTVSCAPKSKNRAEPRGHPHGLKIEGETQAANPRRLAQAAMEQRPSSTAAIMPKLGPWSGTLPTVVIGLYVSLNCQLRMSLLS